MKAFIIALIFAITVTLFVGVNSFALSYNIGKIHDALLSLPNDVSADEEYKEVYEDYNRRQFFLGLTVSHSELTAVSADFAELMGAVEADDMESLIIAKSRLDSSLCYLKRLSSINLDSIF